MTEIPDELLELRGQLDSVDERIMEHLAPLLGFVSQRIVLIDKVTDVKERYNLPARQPERHATQMEHLFAVGLEQGVPPEVVEIIWEGLHEFAVRREEQVLGSGNTVEP